MLWLAVWVGMAMPISLLAGRFIAFGLGELNATKRP